MTSIWGPSYWHFFHLTTTLYPNNPSYTDKKMGNIFLKSIDKILPCPKCAKHYKENINSFKIKDALNSKKNFIKLFIDLHNLVNQQLGEKIISYDDAINKIKKYRNKNIISHFNTVMKYIVYIFPDKKNLSFLTTRGIKNFIKSFLHIAKIKKNNLNIKFNNKKSYNIMHKSLIKKIRN